jgi:LytR cell envelope-related transcriptional attenuator
MTALFSKLTSNGTLEDPITLYKIATSISSNITVDTALDNIGTMASIAESVGSINKKYIQYITAPYVFDTPGEFSYDEAGEHSSPGPGFNQLWTYMRQDEPLPGSPAAAEVGALATTSPSASSNQVATSASANPSPTVAAKDVTVQVFNGTDVDGEAHNAATNLSAMGMTTTVGDSGYTGYATTTIYYPSGDQAEADTLADDVAGADLKQSSSVSELTLVVGANAPTAIVATPSSSAGSDSGDSAATSASPSATISVEARTGDENICSNLPSGQYGGSPSD